MIDDRTLDLIHREIDGANTAEDSARLRDLIAADREARETLDNFRSLAASLNSLLREKPPGGLVEGALEVIRRKSRPAVAGQPVARSPLRPAFFRYGYALAAGLLLGLLAAPVTREWFGNQGSTDPGDLLGTMARGGSQGDRTWNEVKTFGAAGTRGVARLDNSDRASLVELEVASQEADRVIMNFDGGALEIQGFEQLAGPQGYGELAPGRWTWTLQGEARFRLLFRRQKPESSEIRVVVARNDAGICSETIKLPAVR